MAEQLNLGDLIYELGYSNQDEFLRDLDRVFDRAEREAGESGRRAGKGFGSDFGESFKSSFGGAFAGGTLGGIIGTVVGQALGRATQAAKQFSQQSVREFATYEQGLVQLKLAGETNLGPLEDRITRTAEASKVFSRTDISLAIGQLVKAGYDVETAFELVEKGIKGAASEVDPATGKFGDLGQTSVQLGNILRALELPVSQAGRVMDVLAKGAQDSNLDVSDLVDIVAEVGPTAKLAGLEVEDLAGMAAVLSNKGMEASTIGTGLRSVLTALIDPPKAVREEFDRLGVSLVDNEGNTRDINEVLQGLYELTQQGGRGVQTLAQGMDTFALSTATNLGSAAGEVRDFTADLGEAEGAAQELADTVRDSAAGDVAEFEARIADARVELGEQLAPIMVTLYEDILPPFVALTGQAADALEDLVEGMADAANVSAEDFTFFTWLGETFATMSREINGALQAWQDFFAFVNTNIGKIPGLGGVAPKPGVVVDGKIVPADSPEALSALAQADRSEAVTVLPFPLLVNEPPPGNEPPPRVTPPPSGDTGGGTKTRTRTPRATKPEDPLQEEAGRVAADLRRLQDERELDLLSAQAYEDAISAHLRRLMGLYSQATTGEQAAAVLAPANTIQRELTRLEDERLEAVERGLELEERLRLEALERAGNLRAADLERERTRFEEERAEAEGNAELLTTIETAHQERVARINEQYEAEAIRRDTELAQRRAALRDERVGTLQEVLRREAQLQDLSLSEQAGRLEQLLATEEMSAARREELTLEAQMTRKRANEEIAREAQRMQQAEEQRVAEEHRKDLEAGREAQRQAIEADTATAQRAAALREEARQKRLAEAEGAARYEAELYDLTADALADSLGRILAEEELTAEERIRLEREVGLLRKQAADEAADAVIEANKRVAQRIAADTELAGRQFRERQDLEVEALRLSGEAREADLLAAERALERSLEGAGRNLGLRASLTEVHRLQVADINQKYDEEELEAERRRIDSIIKGEGELTEAKRLALVEQLTAELTALGQSEEANVARVKAIEEALAGLHGEKGVDLSSLEKDLTNIAMSFPRALHTGIKDGDLGSALENALGSASDFFIGRMIDGIVGPIAQNLAKSLAGSLGSGLGSSLLSGGIGLALGLGGALLGRLFGSRPKPASERAADRRASSSSTPAITLNATVNMTNTFDTGIDDPVTVAKLRSIASETTVELLERLGVNALLRKEKSGA